MKVLLCTNGLAPQYLLRYVYIKKSLLIPEMPHSQNHLDRTAYCQRNFSVSGLKLWNSLPQDIQNSQSVASFKSHHTNICVLHHHFNYSLFLFYFIYVSYVQM